MTDAAIALTKTKPRPRRQWAPYLLILPSLLYLAVFFAWPMTRAIRLAVWDETALLTLRQEAAAGSAAAGVLPQGAAVSLLDRRSNLAAEADLSGASLTETWFFVQGLDPGGNAVAGWAPESRIRVRTTDAAGAAIGGTVRPKLGAGADPLTSLYSEPNEGSAIAGKLEGSAAVSIGEQAVLEVWFLIEGEGEGERISGWAPSRVLQVYGDGVSGRIDRGDTGQLTRAYIQRMLNDRFFRPAFYTTLLLIVLIIPVQFALAIIMALEIQHPFPGHLCHPPGRV